MQPQNKENNSDFIKYFKDREVNYLFPKTFVSHIRPIIQYNLLHCGVFEAVIWRKNL